jgi:hypothetical protein
MAERKDPPTYEPGRGGPKTHGKDDAPGQNKPRADQDLPGNQAPGRSGSAPGRNPPGQNQPEQQSQKSQIAQYYRSQGRQPDDVIHEVGGMKLTLRDLDG